MCARPPFSFISRLAIDRPSLVIVGFTCDGPRSAVASGVTGQRCTGKSMVDDNVQNMYIQLCFYVYKTARSSGGPLKASNTFNFFLLANRNTTKGVRREILILQNSILDKNT